MTYKKYNLIFAVALAWVVIEMLMTPAVLAAEGDLMIDFENTPLFNEVNFLPGSEVSRWAKVTNNTSDTKPIIVEAINQSDPDGLAGVFEIGIYEGGIQRYGTTTLAAFFAAGEISLSDLAGGGTETQYDFLVRFVPNVDNSYQKKSLGFDILIGFKGDEGGGGGGGGNGGGGDGGGGGGGGGIQGLTIANESTVEVGETSTTVTWLTSFFSTSRVIYDIIPGVFTFSSPPNYGYAFSTPEIDTPASSSGVTFHTVVLTGLLPGTTYYYRTISHASPDTVSFERSFTTSGIRPSIVAISLVGGKTNAEKPVAEGLGTVGGTEDIKNDGLVGEAASETGYLADEKNNAVATLLFGGGDAGTGEKDQDITATGVAAVIFGVRVPHWVLAIIGIAILLVVTIVFRLYHRRT